MREDNARLSALKAVRADRSDGIATNAVAILLVIAFYYLAYRYPLKLNSSLTSPTYSDTPEWLQVGKYLILAVIAVGYAIVTVAHRNSRPTPINGTYLLTGPILTLLAVFATIKGILVGSIDMITLGIILFIGVPLASSALRWKIDAARLARYISIYAIVSVVAEAIQIVLFRTQGRLPALAYENSVTVRFGAVLDDPNGFAIVVALLLPAVWIGWKRGFWRLIFSLALLVALVLTQSFTGIVSVGLALLLGIVVLKWRSPGRFVAILWSAIAGAVIVAIYLFNSQFFSQLLGAKSGSIAAHVGSLEALQTFSWTTFLGLDNPGYFVESSYVALIQNFGLLFVIGYVLIGIAAIARLARAIGQNAVPGNAALYYAVFFYLIAYLLGSSNIQLAGVFPANFLYVLGIVLSLFAPLGAEVSASRRSVGSKPR